MAPHIFIFQEQFPSLRLLRLFRLAHSRLPLFVLAGMFLRVPMAFFDLFRGAFLWLSFKLLRVLTFAVAHIYSLLVAIDFLIQFFNADAFRAR